MRGNEEISCTSRATCRQVRFLRPLLFAAVNAHLLVTLAEAEYKKAAELAPHDPTPLSNLSSVKFEQARYAAAVEYILKALKLVNDDNSSEAVIRKRKTLYERLSKCYMHELRFDEARKIADELSDERLRTSIQDTLTAVHPWFSEGLDSHRMMVFERLPRFKASLYVTDVSTVCYAASNGKIFQEKRTRVLRNRPRYCGISVRRRLGRDLFISGFRFPDVLRQWRRSPPLHDPAYVVSYGDESRKEGLQRRSYHGLGSQASSYSTHAHNFRYDGALHCIKVSESRRS